MLFKAKRGSFSQFSAQFSSPHEQCFGMAVAAVIYGTSQGTDFNNFEVHVLLKSGDSYYRLCLDKMQRSAATASQVQLSADDILSPIKIIGKLFLLFKNVITAKKLRNPTMVRQFHKLRCRPLAKLLVKTQGVGTPSRPKVKQLVFGSGPMSIFYLILIMWMLITWWIAS